MYGRGCCFPIFSLAVFSAHEVILEMRCLGSTQVYFIQAAFREFRCESFYTSSCAAKATADKLCFVSSLCQTGASQLLHTKHIYAVIWILITAAQCLCLSHSFPALRLKLGCYFSSQAVVPYESECMCVTRYIRTLRARLIDSNGFLRWGWGLAKGVIGLMSGSFSKDHSTKGLH